MPYVNVTDPGQEGLFVYSRISDAQLRESDRATHGLFVAESRKVIERALAAGVRPYSMFVEDRWLAQSEELVAAMEAARPGLPVFRVTHAQMQQITGFQITRGPLAAFERPAQPSLQQVLSGAHRIAVLEDITNYTNIGTLFRSAAALGLDGVILTPRCHDPLYKRAARVSMGAVFKVPWHHLEQGEWTQAVLPELKRAGFSVAALDLAPGSLAIDAPELKRVERLALALGTEGAGLTPAAKGACDISVTIPMEHGVDSLNVAAAATLAFWELRWRGQGDARLPA